jgi:hypothetical protein
MKVLPNTLKLHSVSGSKDDDGYCQEQLANGTESRDEWKVRVVGVPCVCRSCQKEVNVLNPFIDTRKETEVWVSECSKPQPRQNTTREGDEALFETASRIIKLSEVK